MLDGMLMFIGTYTRNTPSEGIYAFSVDHEAKRIRPLAINGAIDNPSWLVADPERRLLYAVNEVRDYRGAESGAVSAFSYDEGGGLRLLSQRDSMGADPCHLALGPGGNYLLVSNYGGGSLASFPVESNGELGSFQSFVRHGGSSVDPVRQKAPHVHSITLDRRGELAYVADLGTDEMVMYPVDRNGQVTTASRKSVRVKPGAGPRHFCFDSVDRFGYLINELDNTIVSFERTAAGRLVELETVSTLPDDFTDASYCADIHLSPDCRFLYGSNRGHDSVAVFELGPGGQMRCIQHQPTGGMHPRNIALAPGGRHLFAANRDSDNVVVFARDGETGRLEETGATVDVPAPACIVFAQA